MMTVAPHAPPMPETMAPRFHACCVRSGSAPKAWSNSQADAAKTSSWKTYTPATLRRRAGVSNG